MRERADHVRRLKAEIEANELARRQAQSNQDSEERTASEPHGSIAVPPEESSEVIETQRRWRGTVERATQEQPRQNLWSNYTPPSQTAVRPSMEQPPWRQEASSSSSSSTRRYPPAGNQLKCEICDSNRHYTYQCPQKYCPRCQKFGHNWNQCYYKPRGIDWSLWCDICEDYGHSRRNSCYELKNQQYPYCIWCREQGHLPKWQCRTNKRQRTG